MTCWAAGSALGALLALAIAKLVAWWVALSSGTSGGTLAPLLLVSGAFGSIVGTLFGHLFPAAHISPGAFALVAMAAAFGASIRATFTAIVFLFELTRDYQIILPLMLASVLAELIASALSRDSLMTEKLTRRGLRVLGDYEADVLQTTLVAEVMTRSVDVLRDVASVADARRLLERSAHDGLPVVDTAGHCVGIVTRHDLLSVNRDPGEQVMELASQDVITVAPDDSVLQALQRVLEDDVTHLPVVDGERLVGICTRSDILRARLRQFQHEHLQPGWPPLRTVVNWPHWLGRRLRRRVTGGGLIETSDAAPRPTPTKPGQTGVEGDPATEPRSGAEPSAPEPRSGAEPSAPDAQLPTQSPSAADRTSAGGHEATPERSRKEDPAMREYLVVVNETFGSEALRRVVEDRLRCGPCRFHVVVPAPGPTTLFGSALAAYEGNEPGGDESLAAAGNGLDRELAALRAVGADADGEVADHDPLDAIGHALEHRHAEEIILSTLPAGLSRWVHLDLPHRIEHRFNLPVTTVESCDGAAAPPVPNGDAPAAAGPPSARVDLAGQSTFDDGLDGVLDRLQSDVQELRRAIARLHQHTNGDVHEAERAAVHAQLVASEGTLDRLDDHWRRWRQSPRSSTEAPPTDAEDRLAQLRLHIDQARTDLAHARHEDERHFWD